MKTIWNAVNELKGNLEDCEHYAVSSDAICSYIYVGTDENTRNKGALQVTDEVINNGRWALVSSFVEFNALVTEMSLGLDVNPINEGYYHKYLAADKEELEPIKQNPIYTQKMCDNGELPPIGSMFIDIELDNKEQVEAMAHDLEFGRVIYKRGSTLQDSEYFGAQAHECKPIPPKLELIDGKAYQFDCSKSVKVINDMQGIFISSGDIFLTEGGSFCVSSCTNIKLLTVSD